MGDIYCRKCEEPWDAYGVKNGDMTTTEAEQFLAGDGCPACGFGTRCVSCSGTGKQKAVPSDCRTCFGSRSVLLHKFSWTDIDHWHVAWSKPIVVVSEPLWITSIKVMPSRDGPVKEARAQCPDCHEGALPCSACDGTGAYAGGEDERRDMAFMTSAVDETDDPDEIMARW